MAIKTIIFCRDCKHWKCSSPHLLTDTDCPRNVHPEDGWLNGRCNRISNVISVNIAAGWDGGTVTSIETDANFGCVLGEIKST